MLKFNFSEKKEIEEMQNKGYVNENNYSETILKLATYNLHILGFEKEDNYDAIKAYMKSYSKDFFEPQYMDIIYDKIRIARRIPVTDIDYIPITKSELAYISTLNDIRKEKIAFVLLAVAKFNDIKMQRDDHRANLSNSKICKLARITMKISERDSFMKFLVDDKVVSVSINPKSVSKQVLVVSEDDNDEVILKLHEVDYEELAYNYLSYKNNGVGYTRCEYVNENGEKCGRIIKLNSHNQNHNRKYCEEHIKYQTIGEKLVACANCGKEFKVDSKNSRACRCDECQRDFDKKKKREWYHRNKIQTDQF